MKVLQRRKKALEELIKLLCEIDEYVDIIIVEGNRDIVSLRTLGYNSEIEILNHIGLGDLELAEIIASKYSRVLILTDFDEEGVALNQKFTDIFEHKGVKVERGLRRRFSRLMSTVGVYTIESLDNILTDFS